MTWGDLRWLWRFRGALMRCSKILAVWVCCFRVHFFVIIISLKSIWPTVHCIFHIRYVVVVNRLNRVLEHNLSVNVRIVNNEFAYLVVLGLKIWVGQDLLTWLHRVFFNDLNQLVVEFFAFGDWLPFVRNKCCENSWLLLKKMSFLLSFDHGLGYVSPAS